MRPPRSSDPPPQVGNYEIEDVIGRGGMGVVYKAFDPQLDRHVAIKILHPELVANTELVARFKQEAEAIASLRHPFIVGIYDFRQEGQLHCFTMDYVEGETLEELIHKGELTLHDKLEIVCRFLRALGHAHKRQVIHRDIKPSNIIVDRDLNPHITDFGLARSMDQPSKLTQDGQSLGTPMYMSPEQIRGERDRIDHRSDLYSAGVVLYQLLTGRLPYPASTSMELFKQITGPEPVPTKGLGKLPRRVREVVRRALAKDPQERYPDADTWADDLEPCIDGPRRRSSAALGERFPLRVVAGASCIVATLVTMSWLVIGELGRSARAQNPPGPVRPQDPPPQPTGPDALDLLFQRVRVALNEGRVTLALDTLAKEVRLSANRPAEANARFARLLGHFLTFPKPLNDFAVLSPQKTGLLCTTAWADDPPHLASVAARLSEAGAPLVREGSTAAEGVRLLETAHALGQRSPPLFMGLGRGYAQLKQWVKAREALDRYLGAGGPARRGHFARGKVLYVHGDERLKAGQQEEARGLFAEAQADIRRALAGGEEPQLPNQQQIEILQMLWGTHAAMGQHRDAMGVVGFVNKRFFGGQPFNNFSHWASTVAMNSLAKLPISARAHHRWSFDRFKITGTGRAAGKVVFLLPHRHQFSPLAPRSCLMLKNRASSKLEFHLRMPARIPGRVKMVLDTETPRGDPQGKGALIQLLINDQPVIEDKQLVGPNRRGTVTIDITAHVTPDAPVTVSLGLSARATIQVWLYAVEIVVEDG